MKSRFSRIGLWITFGAPAVIYIGAILVFMIADLYLENAGQPGLCGIHHAPCTDFLKIFIH